MQVGMLAFLGPIGLPELVIIMVILILIFGANRLSGIGKGMGQAIRGFKDEMKTDEPGWEQGKCHRLPHSTHLPLSNPSSGSSLRSVLQTSPIRLQSPQ